MNRRQFLAGSAAITGAATLPRAEGRPASSANRIGRNRISAITDEIAMSPEEAIAFAKHFGLEWLELRNTPELPKQGKPYFFLTEEELKPAAKSFRDAGIRISFLNTNLCKNGLPGTLPVRWAKQDAGSQLTSTAAAQKEYDERNERLTKCIRAAEAFQCPYIRIFTFLRTNDPAATYDRVANIIGEMAEMTHKAGFMLLVENEPACNVGDSTELVSFLKRVPERTVGFNWDARNATLFGEIPFPTGYNLLPKQRMKNVQIKGHDILDPEKPIDWAPILAAMDADGYQGRLGLETHYFDGTRIERSHLAMDKIVKLAEANAKRG
jgi:sugar phosphate isomerase/epimerase